MSEYFKEHWSVVVETLNNDGKPRAVFKYDAVFDARQILNQNLIARRADKEEVAGARGKTSQRRGCHHLLPGAC